MSKDLDKNLPEFQKVQLKFAKHLRDPVNNPAPRGLEDRRLKIYRELFFGNIKSLVSQTFPVLQKFYNQEQWNRLIREFMVGHQAKTPLFLEVSQEFVEFLQSRYLPKDYDPAFMLELAHYEWLELAVSVMDETPDCKAINKDGDPLIGIPYLNPVNSVAAYTFPVHKIKPDFAPSVAPEQPTFLLLYRKLNDSVEFMQLNAVSARLLELMETNTKKTGTELMLQIADELQHPDPDKVVSGGATLLQDFMQKEIVLGTRK